MSAAPDILKIWKKFDSFPMETLTKAWFLKKAPRTKQRTVQQMQEHRAQYGASGNCFDLGLWLIHELKGNGISAYGVGSHWGTKDAHVAVIALDEEGQRYLCDLGDLWIKPLPLGGNPADLAQKRKGYFAGAEVSARINGTLLEVVISRAGGKQSKQRYNLNPVNEKEFFEFGNFSQTNLSQPLVEMRIFNPKETVHWEYDGKESFISSLQGIEKEAPLKTPAEWAQRISKMTGMKEAYVLECLSAF